MGSNNKGIFVGYYPKDHGSSIRIRSFITSMLYMGYNIDQI